MMKLKQQSKKILAWGLTAVMSLSLLFTSGQPAIMKAAETDVNETAVDEEAVTLSNPVIEAEEGQIVWDCVYFGNYYQNRYITQPGNAPTEGQDDVTHEDPDGTKYIVRADKTCYKYEPIKWRVLSVSEDGTDALLMADQCLDRKVFQSKEEGSDTTNSVTWENSDVRTWLNETFMDKAFSAEEQDAIKLTEIDNLSYSSYYYDFKTSSEDDESIEDAEPTGDRIYLPSLDDMVNKTYGFINNFNRTDDSMEKRLSDARTRQADGTDFANSYEDGDISGYLLRTPGAYEGYVFSTDYEGKIPTAKMYSTAANEKKGIRPVLHLDLTKTELWEYAGKVKQDKTEIKPDATPAAATERPTAEPSVTMAPGQTYPKNPVVDKTDLKKNTWDCIYFGNYYNTKITPSVLAFADENDMLSADENGNKHLVRHEQGYFQYEPIKWRVLSINEDGTDAFVMADGVIDVSEYYSDGSVQITWEKSTVRDWLNTTFMERAFNDEETNAIKETTVETADNPWSGLDGGNDTADKVYLPSIEEVLDPSYGFSSDENEGDTRKLLTSTDYAKKEAELDTGSNAYVWWLRSQGGTDAHPAYVGSWIEGQIVSSGSDNTSTRRLGIRPVMHVDLSDTSLWTYAGQVTPEGVVVPKDPAQTQKPTQPEEPTQPTEPTQPITSEQPTQQTTPAQQTQEPQQTEPEVQKPGKVKIKKLKNKKGKKVTVTLSKKVSGAAGYQVAYAMKASMKGQKTKSFKGTSVTLGGLKKKKTYYFRVRAYSKAGGKTVYGNWSSKKSIKVKK